MKLTKKLEAEILKAYNDVWDAYLRGDMRTFASILDENCYIIGSAAGEIFSNKKAAVKYYKSTAEQITGKAEFRNRKINVMATGKGFIVNEESDFYLLIDDQWTFYGPARISSLFHKKNNKWKIIHQHGSFPDSKTEGGEQVNTEKIKAENIQLRDAVKRRTVELENKNRELEVEAALERVRARTMAMQKSDELREAVLVIYEQLKLLNFESSACNIIIIDKESGSAQYWVSGFSREIFPVSYAVPYLNHPYQDALLEPWKQGDKYVVYEYTGKMKQNFDEIFFTQTEFRNVPDDAKNVMIGLKSVMLSTAFISYGALQSLGAEPLSDENANILQRFAKVFEQTYTRFLDLKKAEAQTRESQIELGLERVRARAMAMQNSDELKELIGAMFTELTKLDLVLTRCVILIYEGNEKGVRWWMANSEAPSMPMSFFVKYADLPFFNDYLKGWNERSLKWQYILEGEDKIRTDNVLFNETELSQLPDFVIAGMKANDRVYLSASFNNYGCLNLASLEPLSGEHFDILLRFAKVFDLTYTRFNDLKQAEAQAREARIETALERVRARTMAMQKSDELPETSYLLFQQLKELGETAAQLSIGIIKEEEGFVELSATIHGSQLLQTYDVSMDEPFVMRKALKAWKVKERSLVVELKGKELKDYNNWRNSFLGKKIVFPEEQWIVNIIYFSKGFLSFSSDKQIPEETIQLLERFAGVFDQTYTRFLDLQKAEAQAREAQIEASLEKVRGSAMAMHNSNDISATTSIVFTELRKLGILSIRCGVGLLSKDSRMAPIYAATTSSDGEFHTLRRNTDMTEHPVLAQQYETWLKQENYQAVLSGEELRSYYNLPFFHSSPSYVPPEHYDRKEYGYYIPFTEGLFYAWTEKPYSEDEQNILSRFKTIIALTFRRYLDLQKAETQAREAQIEAALEKVRSRSLAMHKSDELQEVVNTVFERLEDLNIEMDSANIAIFKEGTRDYDYWIASHFQKRAASFHMPHIDLSLTRDVTAARESGTDFSAAAYSFEEKNEWFDYAFKNTDFKFLTEERKQFILNAPGIMVAIAFSKHTGVQVNRYSNKLLTEGEAEILKRFSKVFEQAYIRFLDLEKAEAQAKEAQIEAALEKVRSRSLAMHQSNEIKEVVKQVFKKMKELGFFQNNSVMIVLPKNGFKDILHWTFNENFETMEYYIPAFNHRVSTDPYEAWKRGEKTFEIKLNKEEKDDFLDQIFTYTDYSKVPEEFKKYLYSTEAYNSFEVFENHCGLLVDTFTSVNYSEDQKDIVKRVAKVFEQAYIRFLDLQKAEAQARESQIEASLERVRAKTMAMHNSHDVGETVATMFDELVKLGIQTLRCGVGILYEGYQMELWTAKPNESGKIELFVGHLDMKIHPLLKGGYESWKDKRDSYSYELKDDDLIAYFNAINNYSDYHANYDIASLPSRIFHNLFSFNEGVLFVFSLDQLSAESSQIFKRFAGVFGQTYRRYLDLQKAEAQARESQIEASLERVRSKTMAMHNSEDVGDTVAAMLDELVKLGVETVRCGIAIIDESKTMEVWTASSKEDGSVKLIIGKLDMSIHPLFRMVYDAWKNKVPVTTYELIGEDLKDYFRAVNNSPDYPIRYDIETLPYKQSNTAFIFPEGSLFVFSQAPLTTETTQIFKRFAGVFGQTYRRYLDLLKAEAQAREAKIEASLERVRAKAMAMHKSDDLHGAVTIMFEEFQKLNLDVLRCGIGILNKDSRTGGVWTTSVSDNGLAVQISANESFDTHPLMMLIYEHWQKQEDLDYVLQGQDLINYYRAMDASELKLPKSQLIFSDDELQAQYYYAAMFNAGGLYSFSDKPFAAEDRKIMKRFASVVNLTYNRFLDLQKAEAQAREAKIEAGLERVRARTMAMHSSEDVTSATETMFEEFKKLGIDNLRCGIANIHLNRTFDVFGVTNLPGGNKMTGFGLFGMDEHPVWQRWFESWKNKEEVFIAYLEGQEKEEYFKNINDHNNYLPQRIVDFPDNFFQAYYFEQGSVWAYSLSKHSESEKDIMKRFATGFSLTFRRYQDLQKAEAQAREAQIEAGLERVRARTMAMHSSEDVSVATATMFTELEKLGIENFRGGITIIKPDQTQEVWSITNMADGKTIRAIGVFDMRMHPLWWDLFKGHENKEDYKYYWLAGKDKEEYIAILNATPNYLSQPIKEIPDVHVQSYFFGEGAVWTNSLQPHSEEDKQVMKRFASVFSLTFRRYQDLRKAEAQAKEATIEAALEKVRGKAMAMHNSNDLSVTASMIITELRKLGISPIRCGVGILNKETHKAQLYTATSSADGDSLSVVGWVMLEGHPVLERIYETWVAGEDYFPELSGDSRKAYYEQLLAGLSVPLPDFEASQKHYGHFFAVSVGCLYTWSDVRYNDDEIKTLKRFASIIDLTFRRYFELQKSEANAREAVKQAALDRVRAEIASMRTVSDLEKITPLIWNELTILGVPFIRCGVFIMDESQQLIHTFLSTPDGKAIAAFHLPYDTPGNFGDMLSHWYNKKTYVSHWDEKDFIGIAETLVKQGAVASKEQYLGSLPKGGFYLHFLPFLQGMLYVGNTDKLNSEQIELIQHVADAFSTAYARYEDFNKLEAAKQQVENTLTDLKQAQTQLVQAEKMASLGELTAGIAHEIQNPLNFVNNFSEVSKELLDEMKTELETGNTEDAKDIADDVIQNLEKINHHGKRADAIVKSMLQHSRSSSGKKEPTDINALADEYLRLAYHGLRAKDKSFNAKFETEFDNSIGKINIISQDIGRVLVNLINNAFYAVSERKKQETNGYEPTVEVVTKKVDDKIEIKVKDNGNGIPQKVLDKIFQPFFTTKPTGQGTGLGLSLSYDIIKAHGGELKVETKEGKGAEFIIQIPMN